jgi:hypothetical protein
VDWNGCERGIPNVCLPSRSKRHDFDSNLRKLPVLVDTDLMRLLLALLLSGCAGGCGVLMACPEPSIFGPTTPANPLTTSSGEASISVTNATSYGMTAVQVPAEYPARQNCGLPLAPGGLVLRPGQSGTMSGTFTGCNGDIQGVWLMLNGNGWQSQLCTYSVAYSPVSHSFGITRVDSVGMGTDTACTLDAKTNGAATITYRYEGSVK